MKTSQIRALSIIIAVSILFISCTKENETTPVSTPTTPTEPTSYFKYKFNGTLVEMNGTLANNSREGSLIRKIQQTKNQSSNDYLNNTNYIYKLMATKNYFFSDDGEPFIDIRLNTTNLSATNFSRATNGIIYVMTYYPLQGVSEANWDFTLIISSISNGYATGTFSGKLNKTGTSTYYNITEGEFKNVKILE